MATSAEGFDGGQGKLLGLPLPLPTDVATEPQEETEASSPAEKLAINLDLEFPPLLAAKTAPGAGEIHCRTTVVPWLKILVTVIG